MELNREQIVKALECCVESTCCEECPACGFCYGQEWVVENALAIIRELTEENKRIAHESACHRQTVIDNLRESLEYLYEETERVRADTVRNMQERIHGKAYTNNYCQEIVLESDIDRIAQEMLEEG